MASAGACVGSLLPRASWCSPSGAKGQGDGAGSWGLALGRCSAAKRGNKAFRNVGLCRAAQSSSSGQRHAIITGGNTGIGKATAVELARLGMSVTIGEKFNLHNELCANPTFAKFEHEVLSVRNVDAREGWLKEACRDLAKGEQAVSDIIRASTSSSVRAMQLDLASFASVREFAAEYLDSGLPLNSLVNNAGVMACPLQYTVDGFEYQLGVNHLGHFLLTALLLDKLKSSSSPGTQSRVVVLASAAERIGSINFADLNYKTRKYNEWQAYGQSKLANCLFSHELARRCKSLNIPITSNCMHPGVVDTDLSRYIFPQSMSKNMPSIPGLRPTLTRLLGLKTPEEGASTAVYLANAYEVEGKTGGYYESSRMVSPSARAVNSKLSYSLWAVSEELTGTTDVLEPLRLSVRTASILNA